MERALALGLLPTAPMVYAVIYDLAMVDDPDIPSYQPDVYGRCDPPALIPLQMKEIEVQVDCHVDTAVIAVRERWRVHCVMGRRSCDCRLVVPTSDQIVWKKLMSNVSLAPFKDGKNTKLPYPLNNYNSDVAGRSFHNGRFIQRMREKAATMSNVKLEQGTVTTLLEERGIVKGVSYKTGAGEERKAYAPLTVVCDGCFSNLRRTLYTPMVG